MRVPVRALLAVMAAVAGSEVVKAAEFSYSVDISVSYQGDFPKDGKYLQKNFLFAAKPNGFTPKDLNIYADLSTGPGTPVLAQANCGLGEFPAGWTNIYQGIKGMCNWSNEDVVTTPQGKTLYVSVSNAFKAPSMFPVVVEAVKPFPDKTAKKCAPPANRYEMPRGSASRVSVNVYQLADAVAADGTLDQTKICVVVTPRSQDVVGLSMWGTLTARLGKKETLVGRFGCPRGDIPAGTSVDCTPPGNNAIPEKMSVPKGAKLYIASRVTFGHTQTTPLTPVPLQTYGAMPHDEK